MLEYFSTLEKKTAGIAIFQTSSVLQLKLREQ